MKKLMLAILLTAISAAAQTEVLTNADIVTLTKSGLPAAVIEKKIRDTENTFDVRVEALIALKNDGVAPEIIQMMLERAAKTPVNPVRNELPKVPAPNAAATPERGQKRTIMLVKKSVQPSLAALEKELMKRKEWADLGLTIVQNWENADYYVEIEFVHLSLLTHRYTFRVYDRRSRQVVAAGETTSWGSLAENLARNIAKSLNKAFAR